MDDAAEGGDAGGQFSAVSQRRIYVGQLSGDVKRRAPGRTLVVGPIPAAFHPQHVSQRQAEGGMQRIRDRRDQPGRAVAHRHDGNDALLAEDGCRVRGDVGGVVRVGWVGQLIAQRQLDAISRRLGADHDHAVFRGEAQQAGHGSQQLGRRGYPHAHARLCGVLLSHCDHLLDCRLRRHGHGQADLSMTEPAQLSSARVCVRSCWPMGSARMTTESVRTRS